VVCAPKCREKGGGGMVAVAGGVRAVHWALSVEARDSGLGGGTDWGDMKKRDNIDFLTRFALSS